MIKVSKYTKLGFVVISSLAILIWGINYLKGIDILKKNTEYYVVYDKVDGLVRSSPVTINGFQVGQVSDIRFLNDYSGRLIATLSIKDQFRIGKGSVASIVSSDIMGSKSVKFDLVKSTDYYKPHDTIPGNVEGGLKEQVSMQVLPLKHKAEQLIASLDSAISVVTYVFNKKTRNNLTESFENINKTIENIQSTTAELNKIMTSGKINAIVTNIDSLTATFKNNSGQIANVIQNLSQLSDSLSKLKVSPLFDQLSSTVSSLNQIVHKLNTTDGTAGLLINDPKLYNNLSELSRSLDLLLKDIRVNPKRYVHFSAFNFGKDVYITSRPGDDQKKDQIVYKVHLISSLAKLSLESTFFKGLGPIEEIKISDTYNYLAGETSNFEEINNLLDKARGNFPDATLVAFKNGRMIKLEKAIKKQTDE